MAGHCKDCKRWDGPEWQRCQCNKFVWETGREYDPASDGVLL